ncbi:MAG: Gfo/Idh/MocA family oxidoreductase [Kiritimatiellae bacterium]|nr:Gfo/Idh/MocA family oxidoreductase [Kiritimatiellia bacterium]
MNASDPIGRREFLQGAMGAAVLAAASAEAAASRRAAGTVMDLKTPPMERVRIGLVGIGARGSGAIGRLLAIEGVEITALCDVRPERVAAAQVALEKAKRPKAREYTGAEDAWHGLCADANVDVVYNCTPWRLHTPIAVRAMREGKHALVEVPAAVTMEECWELVETAEATRRHCMMLENCCYGPTELMVLRMCREGLLGELVHGEGAYIHDLRAAKMSEGGYHRFWRLEESVRRNGNLYPTHGLGPIAQYMGINRGDRFERLVSMSSMERGLTLWAETHYPPEDFRRRQRYRLGDMNTTIIRTARGRTIMVQHDTTSPRPYSRINLISGTKGCFADYPPRLALEPDAHKWIEGEALKEYEKKYEHPLWARVGEEAKRVGGHGGMDFVMDWRTIWCLRHGEPLDQSVYDAAAWSAIAPLSEWSVARGGEPVEVPDFTRGVWQSTPPLPVVSG